MEPQETTDITLFVRTSGEDITRWDRRKIVDALIRETSIDVETAEGISREVERQIVASGIALLTTNLIREMVDAKLIERGLENQRRMHARIGFPLYDVRQLILHQNKENANLPHSPEGTNLVFAEGIKREYALHDVFSQDIGDAHILGDIHIHSMGYIDRPYSCCQSLEYIKKFGLDLPHSMTLAKPAKHAEVLLAHMVRFGAILQGQFAGIIAWDAVNLFLAPFLTGKTDKEVRQFAQMLIYEFSQMTAARGGQSIFTDIHLYWEVPSHFKDVPAIGPGGDFTGKTYNDYGEDARRFARAIFQVLKKGDATGSPFIFPRPFIHITEELFQTPDYALFLQEACDAASEKGNPYFLFEREDDPQIMICGSCDYFRPGDEDFQNPWKMRWAAMQNVTLNLPRVSYKAKGDEAVLFKLLGELMELAAKAHLQKRNFIQRLLSYGPSGPLAILAMNKDGLPYLRMEKTSYYVGVLGLNELVQIHLGKQLHETAAAIAFGLKVVRFLKEKADGLSKLHGIDIILEQSPAETTGYRFAKLDLRYHSPEAGRIVKGDLSKGEIFYTNSTDLNVSSFLKPLERLEMEGLFHPYFGGAAVSHIWLGDQGPTGETLAALVVDIYRKTNVKVVTFSPEFTTCPVCRITVRGLTGKCASCGRELAEGISRITQYYSRISGWNRGKIGELKARHRYDDSDFT
ncbi:MAG: anaerobic ribonucleoside-triphosphate reductase [Syntrophaceae bacterium]|nr:anaerobic ribonucleoside-triphosphate reductase [Syntrophaceae bacterium]